MVSLHKSFQYSNTPFLIIAVPFLVYVICACCARLFVYFTRVPFLQNAALRALQNGPIPNHIAFIMDGNRRWAIKSKLPSHKGHAMGKETFMQMLQWCLQAGVKIVTVYGWSLENFKRPNVEVEEIMRLAKQEAEAFSNKSHVIHQNQVRVRFLGDLERLPIDLRRHMAQLMRDTMQYTNGPVLNICFSYTSRHDMASAVADVSAIARSRGLPPSLITDEVIATCLSTGWGKGANACMHPQLLVRTSGETRLSDFLLYESTHSIICFYPVLWPDLSAWDFVQIVLQYQSIIKRRVPHECSQCPAGHGSFDMDPRLKDAVTEIRNQYFEKLAQLAKSSPNP